MQTLYFAAKIQQEFVDTICKKAISIGVPKENILLSREACRLLQLGIYIKFNDVDTYNKFDIRDIPGIVEIW